MASFEGVCLTHVILAPGACGRGVRAAVAATTSAGSAGSGDELQIVQIHNVFTAKVTRVTLQCNVFFTLSYPSRLKHLVLIVFLEDCLPEMLSKLGVRAEMGMKKSKAHRAIAPAALGGCGGLGQL